VVVEGRGKAGLSGAILWGYSMTRSLYERDFYAWANEQAALLRSGRLEAVDIELVAEEIESMGRSEKRELVSRLTILLLHLLKWQFQPAKRGSSWIRSIEEQRLQLADHLDDNPSLRALLPASMARAWQLAVIAAVDETGLEKTAFPAACPFSFDQAIDAGFWPDQPNS
jgi:hypothetical protein